jgi:hypothetical protein
MSGDVRVRGKARPTSDMTKPTRMTRIGHREGQRQSVNKTGVGSELWPEPFLETTEAPDAYSPTYPILYQPPRK